jgi:hypothetical protein
MPGLRMNRHVTSQNPVMVRRHATVQVNHEATEAAPET